MARTKVDIPDEFMADIEAYKDRLGEILMLGLSQVKIQESLFIYQRGLVSLSRAAELARISEREMVYHARAAGLSPPWTDEMVAEELMRWN